MSLRPIPADAWLVMGNPMWVTLPASSSGGQLTMMESAAAAGVGPPLHVHANEDEAFHILAGRFRARLGDQVREFGPGESVFLPRGVPHTYRCLGPETGRMLVLITPSGFEGFFREWHETPLRMPEDEAAIADRMARYSVRFVGPPLE
jgi:quercetin dioxygenase-like cupin family protein